jgi:hypothetical protein
MIRYHNPKFSGSPSIPIAVGDRFYAQDLLRNFRRLMSIDGEILKRTFGQSEIIIEGLEVSQGTGHTLDITSGKCIGNFEVEIPHPTDTWAMPPNTDTEDIIVLIDVPSNITNMTITSAVTDGVTVNYVKIVYTETNGNTRQRAKKAGTYAYEVIPDYTITVDDTAPTSYEVVLETFTSDGATITFLGNEDLRIDKSFSNEGSYTNITTSQILKVNKKYKASGNLELTLPEANEGDSIEIFVEDDCKLLQADSNNGISYLNSFFTTKGSSGYLDLLRQNFIKIIYKGNGISQLEPLDTKLSDPSSLPPHDSFGCAFSHDDTYLAVVHNNSPYVTIYKRSGDTFTKLSNPANLPTGTGRGCAFSQDDIYLAVAHYTSPYVTIYKRSGDTFTKLSNPANLPTGNATGCAFSQDMVYLAVTHNTSPYVTIYKRSGDTFTKLSNPANLPAGTGNGCAFSYDGIYLAVAHNTSPYITIYKRNGDTFTKLSNPANLPSNVGRTCSFSRDGKYLAVAHIDSPYITIYKYSGDVFIKLDDPAALPNGDAQNCSFSYDDKFLVVGSSVLDYVIIYKHIGDAFMKISDLFDLPAGIVRGSAFSYNGSSYLAVAHSTSPHITIYKNINTITKAWYITILNTLYKQNLEYMFH